MASETEHCGQKQIRRAADFCRGLIPTVWANMYIAIDLCPASSSRLQRRQYKFSKGPFLQSRDAWSKQILSPRPARAQVCRKIPDERAAWIDHPRFLKQADSSVFQTQRGGL